MEAKAGIGFIGCGTIARLYASELHRIPGTSLVGAIGRTRQRAEELAGFYGMPLAGTDADELLARDDVRLVVVTTPNHLHAGPTIAAAKAGKHVFCDKPLATTLGDAKAMIAACRDAGVHLFYGEQDRFMPFLEKLHQALSAGAIGKPFMLRAHRGYTLRPDDPRWKWWRTRETSGGGCLMDAGSHDLYNIRWLMGEVESVHAVTGSYVQPNEAEDAAIVQLRFDSGAMGVLTSTWGQIEGFAAHIEVLGVQGSLRVDWPRDFPLRGYSESGLAAVRNDLPVCWSYPLTGYTRELTHVVDCLHGRAQPLVTGEDGLAILRIIQAAYRSAEQARQVSIAEMD